MPLVVYGDVYFLVNFSIDFLVLTLCGRFMRLRRRLFRILLASFIGGGYAVLSLLPSLAPWQTLALQFGMAALLCFVAYGRQTFLSFLQLFVAFYGAALLFGGAVNAFYTLLAELFGTAGAGAAVSERKAEMFMLYALISGAVIYLAGRVLARRRRVRSMEIEAEADGKRVRFSGLVDSGNLLSDPLSGKAVIVVRESAVALLLPRGAKGMLSGSSEAERIPLADRRRLRVIVARGIDGGRALLGYIPDAVLLYEKENEKNKRAVDAILAVYDGETRDFSGCDAVVPAVLVG